MEGHKNPDERSNTFYKNKLEEDEQIIENILIYCTYSNLYRRDNPIRRMFTNGFFDKLNPLSQIFVSREVRKGSTVHGNT